MFFQCPCTVLYRLNFVLNESLIMLSLGYISLTSQVAPALNSILTTVTPSLSKDSPNTMM